MYLLNLYGHFGGEKLDDLSNIGPDNLLLNVSQSKSCFYDELIFFFSVLSHYNFSTHQRHLDFTYGLVLFFIQIEISVHQPQSRVALFSPLAGIRE